LGPEVDKVLNLSIIHKLNVVYVSVFLSFKGHVFRDATVAESFWIGLMQIAIGNKGESLISWGLAIGAFVIYGVI
jgi:hypothetical protein